jgi:hypothetical protein
MDAPTATPPTPPSTWTAIRVAALKATVLAALLGGFFLVLPGTWNWRITLTVAGVFWLYTFVFSLFSGWAKAKLMAHFSK